MFSAVYLFAESLARALEVDARFAAAVLPATQHGMARLLSRPPDVILLDVSSVDDHDIARRLVCEGTTPVIGLGIHGADSEVVGWAQMGLSGMMTPDASLAEVAGAIVAVTRQETICSPALVGPLMRRLQTSAPKHPNCDPRARLTVREREILELLELGLSNRAIAARLTVGVSTVKNHVHNVLQKLAVTTRAEAVAQLRHHEI